MLYIWLFEVVASLSNRFLSIKESYALKLFYPLNTVRWRGESLPGIFGTNAPLSADLTLLVQIVSFILLLWALVYKIKRKFKIHGSLMGVAVVMHFITFLIVMGPPFVESFSILATNTQQTVVQILLVHAISGALSLILGFYLVVAWTLKMSSIKPCLGRKRIMDATTVLWAISLAFGLATYVALYV